MSRRESTLRQRLRARSPSATTPAWLPTTVFAGLAVFVAALGAVIVLRAPQPSDGEAETVAPRAQGPPASPSGATPGVQPPPPPGELPPLPEVPRRAARPQGVIRAVYEFAARHPEVLSYIPCFCGCERKGHRSNHDCFVAARDADGRVAWSPHGMT